MVWWGQSAREGCRGSRTIRGKFFSALQRDQHRSAVNNSHKRTSTRKPLDRTFDSRVKPLLKKFMSSTGEWRGEEIQRESAVCRDIMLCCPINWCMDLRRLFVEPLRFTLAASNKKATLKRKILWINRLCVCMIWIQSSTTYRIPWYHELVESVTNRTKDTIFG